MFKTTLLSAALATLLFSGCSSNDPKDIAVELCEYSKQADIVSMKKYASEGFQEQLDQVIKMLEFAKSTDEGREVLQTQIDKFASVNCQETTTLTQESQDVMRVVNTATQQNYTLKAVDGSWKMFP